MVCDNLQHERMDCRTSFILSPCIRTCCFNRTSLRSVAALQTSASSIAPCSAGILPGTKYCLQMGCPMKHISIRHIAISIHSHVRRGLYKGAVCLAGMHAN